MLTRLREIVEKVASAPRLNEALNILVTDICLAMDTEVCSVYLADHDRRCYYLMATRGLKKPRGRTVTLAFDEGIVGLVGRLAEPINLADAQKHPSFKYIPSVKEERFRAFLGVPIIQRRQLLGVLVVQQRELRQYDESEESFLVTLATQMAAILDEVDEARRLIERAGREVEEMIGYEIPKPRIGIMLEVPSMVFMLPHLAKRVDFISVGTNDLTQYILAVDRNNTRVANIYDSLHPAMLRALAMIAREAEIHGIDLRLCGEMAGDPMCVAILIGLGYRHLSMNGRSVARVKYLLRRIDYADAENLAQRSLEAQLATEVRHQVAAFMERRGMGGLIRGGL